MLKRTLWLCGLSLMLGGCQQTSFERYASSRLADFMDIFQIGGGVTAENPVTGVIPPSLGLYVQATEFLNLGAMHFHGVGAEIDGRGMFAGPESRVRYGFGPWQRIQIRQFYDIGSENYFKKVDGAWTRRMNSKRMRWWHKPAKELEYEYWAYSRHEGMPIMHRGWQYWENFNIEACIAEPFLTHMGFNVRLGFDPSEIFDFLLGWTTLDFKRDDLTAEEYVEYASGAGGGLRNDNASSAEIRAIGPTSEETAAMLLRLVTIYFDYDKSDIRPDQRARMEENLNVLRQAAQFPFVIEGHCDERGTVEYNYSLGERRAMAVRDWLIGQGIDAGRIKVISKGEVEPAAAGHNEAAWSLNRRAEFEESK